MLNSTPRSTPSMPKKRRGDRVSWEARRLDAGRLFRGGFSQAEVCRELGAAPQSVHRWYHQWREGGVAALRVVAVAGRPFALTAAQLRRVERVLLKGALASGFPTELWTLERVGVVMERVAGVRYGKSNVWLLLQAGLDASTAHPAGGGARRAGGDPLGEGRVARVKKRQTA